MGTNRLDLYLSKRPLMQTGDLLLWKSDTVLGKAIQWFSKSDVNHAGLVLRLSEYDTERVFTLEALAGGIVLRVLSSRLAAHKGECYWCPLKLEYTIPYRQSLGREALLMVGTKYDYGSLFKQALSRVSTNAEKLFCSEFVGLTWKRAGLPVNTAKAPRPGDMEQDFALVLNERIRIF